MTTIIVTHEDNEVDEFEFESAQRVISIGRRSSNDVCIPDLSVSGNHAKITLQDGQAWLEDLNSTNGSYVNGQVIFRQPVGNDDEIMMGKIRLNVLCDAVQSAAASIDAERQQNTGRTNATFHSSAGTGQSSSSEVGATPPERPASFADSDPALPVDELPISRDRSSEGIARAEAPVRPNLDASHASLNGFSPNNHQSRSSDSATASSGLPASENVAESKTDPGKDPGSDLSGKDSQHPLEGMEHLVVSPPGKPAVTPMHELDTPSKSSNGAVIEIKNGAKSGQILPIDKPVTTLGRPGIQIAAIMRKPDGYFLMHIESDDSVDRPTLNRDAIGDEPVLLHSGDELNVAGIDVEFMLS